MRKFCRNGHAGPQASASPARLPRATSWLFLGLLTACASPVSYDFPNRDKAYESHLENAKSCKFGKGQNDPYPGYHVENHILEATEQGGIKYRASGGANDDFWLNFLRIFNCYGKFREWRDAKRQESKQVLIYLNGGLNSPSAVHRKAKAQVPIMLADGYYPIFLIWPTGALDTYAEQMAFVSDGIRHSDARIIQAPLYFVGDIGQGLARAPVNYLDQTLRAMRSRNPFDEADEREFSLNPAICRRPDPKESFGETSTANSEDEEEEKVCEKEETDVSKFGIEKGRVTADRNLMTGEKPDDKPGPTWRLLPYVGLSPVRFVSMPLVDAFGKTMWENMVRRTRTTIRRPVEYDINLVDNFKPEEIQIIKKDKQRFPNGLGAFARFFTMLQNCIGRDEKKCKTDDLSPLCSTKSNRDEKTKICGAVTRRYWRDIDLTVIGHSMGAIVMNELIPTHPNLPYRNIVFMAAAASIRDTTRAMSPVLLRANGVGGQSDANAGKCRPVRDTDNKAELRFYSLMLHPQNDANELAAYGAAPSGSLLAWVDQMYASPETVIDRTMGTWRNLRAAKHVFPKEVQGKMLFRVFSWDSDWSNNRVPDPPPCDPNKHDGAAKTPPNRFEPPTTHGGFNETKARFWCPFFWGADKVRWWGPGSRWNPRVCTSQPKSN